MITSVQCSVSILKPQFVDRSRDGVRVLEPDRESSILILMAFRGRRESVLLPTILLLEYLNIEKYPNLQIDALKRVANQSRSPSGGDLARADFLYYWAFPFEDLALSCSPLLSSVHLILYTEPINIRLLYFWVLYHIMSILSPASHLHKYLNWIMIKISMSIKDHENGW